MSGATTPTTTEPPASLPTLDDRDMEPRTPMKRLGSTRKLAAFSNIRIQLSEQTRVLEGRAEAAAGVAGELHDYCRRRADLEHEYSRALDKLARAATQRHKDQKHKREQWSLTGAFACWQAALDNTRALSRDHAALGDLYGGPLAARLQRAADDALRLHRKCRDIVSERHEEVGAALAEASGAGKAHAAAAAEWRAAALKLRTAHEQRQRLAAAEPARPKKLKALDKELDKRRTRHSEARARALKARADYVLSLEAANATLQRYYLDDIADIMLCSEVGFEAVVGRAVRTAAAAEGARARAAGGAAGALRAAADALDALADRQRVVDAHAAAFQLPRPLPYRGTPPDREDAELRDLVAGAADERDAAAAAARDDLAQRLQQLEAGARQLRAEVRESAKTLDAAEAELVRQMEGGDAAWDVAGLFGPAAAAAAAPAPPAPPADDADAPRRDLEDYYLQKFRSYVACAGRLARLDSKAAAARARLPAGAPPPPASPPSPPRRAAARLRRGQFAAPLGGRLPVVLTSCVRVVAGYGLRHQGVFRVSGSQVEMQALRAAFERGEDPLAHVRDASDINSVCGLLKMYLREVRPPLLPPQLQDVLLRIAALPSDAEFVRRMRDTLAALPQPAVLVLRYLFAFLSHLTEYSEHNMMDAWNLAICLGPTLLAAWGEGGAQVTAQNLVNELVKRTIVHHAAVFPQHVAPHALYSRLDAAAGDAAAAAAPAPAAPAALAAPAAPAAAPAGEQRPLPADDLLLYDDDDDEISEDGESGEWCNPNCTENYRPCTMGNACAVRLAVSTPDLVLDLPARDAATPPKPPKPACASGSPVPARNTARVAAKFAELTLTGGSLKPALAAKPALLRRPTPHPQHVRAAPPPARDCGDAPG
ncbi:LOW QUALITY PROTEIN: rho GTPase-activating protein 4 [Aphomia sociella]